MNYKVNVGTQETTVIPEFFDITSVVCLDDLPEKFEKVFLGKFTSNPAFAILQFLDN